MKLPELKSDKTPHLGFRFRVLFMAGGAVPNTLDILFRKVSGLGASISTSPVEEGGQNLYTQNLPGKVQYENLVLERGMISGSPLVLEIKAAMALFKFAPSNVLVSLLGEDGQPVSAWMAFKAFPVKWRISDLDATGNDVVVETIELSYQRLQAIGV